MKDFYESVAGYVDIAFDEPNLFKYLYMSTDSGCVTDSFGFDALTVKENEADLVEQVAIGLVQTMTKNKIINS